MGNGRRTQAEQGVEKKQRLEFLKGEVAKSDSVEYWREEKDMEKEL